MTQLSKERLENLLQHNDETSSSANAEMWEVKEMARRLLAVEGQEPVAYIGNQMLESLCDEGGRICGRVWRYNTDEMSGESRVPLYAAPKPAPVALPVQVPESLKDRLITICDLVEDNDEYCQDIWNACRAAMLQPSSGALQVPMQPLVIDGHGTLRFKENPIVRKLLDYATERGYGLNEIAMKQFDAEDQMQLAQLIGYSLSGYGMLSYVTDDSYERAAASAPQEPTKC